MWQSTPMGGNEGLASASIVNANAGALKQERTEYGSVSSILSQAKNSSYVTDMRLNLRVREP